MDCRSVKAPSGIMDTSLPCKDLKKKGKEAFKATHLHRSEISYGEDGAYDLQDAEGKQSGKGVALHALQFVVTYDPARSREDGKSK